MIFSSLKSRLRRVRNFLSAHTLTTNRLVRDLTEATQETNKTLEAIAKSLASSAQTRTTNDLMREVAQATHETNRTLSALAKDVEKLSHYINALDEERKVPGYHKPDLISKVNETEVAGSVDLIRAHLDKVLLHDTPNELRSFALQQAPKTGSLLEFGVFTARSTNYFAGVLKQRKDPRTWHGFDSFEGLSHVGHGWLWRKGLFNLDGVLPEVLDNVVLHKGWVDETLPPFLEEFDDTIALLHMDLDIYEPTHSVLTLCKPYLRPGSIIVFDELVGFAGWRLHEYKALTELFDEDEYEYIAFSSMYQAAIRITDKLRT